TEGDGMMWYEPDLNRLTRASFEPSKKGNREIGDFITTLTREKQDQILVGTYSGLFRINPDAGISQIVGDDQLSELKIYEVLEMDNCWLIATQYGIQKMPKAQKDSIISFFADTSVKNVVYSMVK